MQKKLSLFLMLFSFFLLESCSDGSDVDSSDFHVENVSGVAEKGPFVRGSSVVLYELNPETFAQTGKVFTGSVDGDDGSFSIGNVELNSPYVLVEINGYYWHEIYGKKTTNTLSLKAVASIKEGTKVNVNVGTDITYKRIFRLVQEGVSFEEAKVQAETELSKAIFGEESNIEFEKSSIFDNDRLLALTQIVLSAGTESDVVEMLSLLGDNPNDEQLLVKLADRNALNYQYSEFMRKFINEKYPDVEIGWFDKYVISFWERIYGLEFCDASLAGTLDTVHAESSDNDGRVVYCKNENGACYWKLATELEINTAEIDSPEDGMLVYAASDSSMAFVYDSLEWREATATEIRFDKGCPASAWGTLETFYNRVYRVYVCSSSGWSEASIWNYENKKDMFFNDSIEYGQVTDERDGRVYRTLEIGDRTWMAENLSYSGVNANCSDSLVVGCLYDWFTALGLANGDTIISGEVYQGVCMDGWHVPDSTEWRSLLNEIPLNSLKSTVGWADGNNESGFSIVPMAYLTGAGVVYSYTSKAYSNFIVANSETGTSVLGNTPITDGYFAVIDVASSEIRAMASKAVLRCVKDSE